MKTLGVALMWSVGVPGILFGITYGMGCSKDAENSAMIGVGVKGNCPDDGNPCTIEHCADGTVHIEEVQADTPVGDGLTECSHLVCTKINNVMRPQEKPLSRNEICSVGVCDGTGNCVSSCGDTELNGDEEGTDCGGKWCKKCLGTPCNADLECASVHCADGLCCNESCDGDCRSCKQTDNFGTCTFLPQSWVDGTCNSGNACDGKGQCKAKHGSQCNKDVDCMPNLRCVGACINDFKICGTPGSNCSADDTCIRLCRSQANAPCMQPEDCSSLECSGGACQP